jgi:restriction endonuclease S subunit
LKWDCIAQFSGIDFPSAIPMWVATGHRVLNKQDFLEIEIPFPPKNEQDRIAAILGTADHEVEVLEAKKAALKKQKRGLMQKLLTGEWRVSIDRTIDEPAMRKAAG